MLIHPLFLASFRVAHQAPSVLLLLRCADSLSLANYSQHMHSFLPNFVVWYFPDRYLLRSPQCALYNLDLFFCCPSGSILKLRGSKPTLGPSSISIRFLGKGEGSSMPYLIHTHTQEKSRPASLYTRL